MSTQEGGASRDGFGVLASATFPAFKNHKVAHDLPHPSWVYIDIHLKVHNLAWLSRPLRSFVSTVVCFDGEVKARNVLRARPGGDPACRKDAMNTRRRRITVSFVVFPASVPTLLPHAVGPHVPGPQSAPSLK